MSEGEKIKKSKFHKNCSYEYTDNPREYRSFDHMKQRCYNENNDSYQYYGGRGIKVCERWIDKEKGFHNFLNDMGPRPEGCSLDRIDNDKDYCPENCRWSNKSIQSYNQRSGEHSTKYIGVSLSYTGKKKKPLYTAHITKDYTLYRKTFSKEIDALIWRAKQEEELFGIDSMTSDKMTALVIDWGRRHKIKNPQLQMLKVVEEVAEIAREVVRGRLGSDEIKDSIGDSLITIIILADILGLNPINELEKAYQVIRDRKGKTVDGTFIKEV